MLVYINVPLSYLQVLKLHFLLKVRFLFSLYSNVAEVTKHIAYNNYCRQIRDMKGFQHHCNNYFMEVVTTLCFGGDSMPEPELIKMLMDIIFMENDSTRDLTPFTDDKGDKGQIIRSSLLLEHR